MVEFSWKPFVREALGARLGSLNFQADAGSH
jgi:hypothetical protein